MVWLFLKVVRSIQVMRSHLAEDVLWICCAAWRKADKKSLKISLLNGVTELFLEQIWDNNNGDQYEASADSFLLFVFKFAVSW